jgi:hypothetical protein
MSTTGFTGGDSQIEKQLAKKKKKISGLFFFSFSFVKESYCVVIPVCKLNTKETISYSKPCFNSQAIYFLHFFPFASLVTMVIPYWHNLG